MNKHMIFLPFLLVSATALLFWSLSMEEDGTVVVLAPSAKPSVLQTALPVTSAKPSAVAASGKPSAAPSASPVASPSPSPTATPLPSFGISATSPEAVLREAQTHTGRMDPFKSILPPELPEFAPQIEPEQLAYVPPPVMTVSGGPAPVPLKTALPKLPEPAPEPLLTEGLSLKGIVNGGLDPVAIVQVNGDSELVRVGGRLPGNILVTSIHYEGRYITLSRGNQKARLELEEE
jgi:hypothetical protein